MLELVAEKYDRKQESGNIFITKFPYALVVAISEIVKKDDQVARQTIGYLMDHQPTRAFEERYAKVYGVFEKTEWLRQEGNEPHVRDLVNDSISERQVYRIYHWAGIRLREYKKKNTKTRASNPA